MLEISSFLFVSPYGWKNKQRIGWINWICSNCMIGSLHNLYTEQQQTLLSSKEQQGPLFSGTKTYVQQHQTYILFRWPSWQTCEGPVLIKFLSRGDFDELPFILKTELLKSNQQITVNFLFLTFSQYVFTCCTNKSVN